MSMVKEDDIIDVTVWMWLRNYSLSHYCFLRKSNELHYNVLIYCGNAMQWIPRNKRTWQAMCAAELHYW